MKKTWKKEKTKDNAVLRTLSQLIGEIIVWRKSYVDINNNESELFRKTRDR